MKKILLLLLVVISLHARAQTDLIPQYRNAESMLAAKNTSGAYSLLKQLEAQCSKEDTLYNYILWHYAQAATLLEKQFRDTEKFDSSLLYGREALQLIRKGKLIFDESYGAREYWMLKNIIVSHFGLGQLDSGQFYKKELYQAYRDRKLPKGLDGYFNFSFFKLDNKNIWGYEWFEDLPKDRMSKSFSKVVYYVYSTNADGSDKDQLYRLHVLMFHKLDESVQFDYVLTKRLETAKNEVSGTLYSYTYNEDIDFKKLEADIRQVVKGSYEPDTKTTIKKE